MLKQSILMGFSLAAVLAPAASGRPSDADLSAAKRLQQSFVEGWRRADPDAIAANFTDDGDLINPTGVHAAGRAAISGFYAQAFAAGYRGSDADFTIRLTRRIAPGVILIDGELRITGARKGDGTAIPDVQGIATGLLVKTPRGWRLAALREQSSASKIAP
jgi:uncharacterized protein (TIGR02246 family)